MTNKKWIQKALAGHKAGALHRQLGIPKGWTIPISTLEKIKNTKIGYQVIVKDEAITVTPLLKRRVVLALNLRR
jgi:hypothetical protein